MTRQQDGGLGLEAAGYKRADWSADRRAQWLLTFASLDLNRTTQGQSRQLHADLAGFLWSSYATQTGGRISMSPSGRLVRVDRPARAIFMTGRIAAPSRATLVRWQRWLRHGLSTLSRDERQRNVWLIAPKGMAYSLQRVGPGLVGQSVMMRASTKDWFRDFTYQTFVEAERLRFCKVCGQPFLRQRRQEYCTPRCSQKIRTFTHRYHHRERINERRREAYEKKQRETHGANVVVRRRVQR